MVFQKEEGNTIWKFTTAWNQKGSFQLPEATRWLNLASCKPTGFGIVPFLWLRGANRSEINFNWACSHVVCIRKWYGNWNWRSTNKFVTGNKSSNIYKDSSAQPKFYISLSRESIRVRVSIPCPIESDPYIDEHTDNPSYMCHTIWENTSHCICVGYICYNQYNEPYPVWYMSFQW